MEMCTFANRKGTLSTIQVYRKFLLYQEDNTRFSVEKKRFELYTIKNVDKTKRGESDREDDDKRLL